MPILIALNGSAPNRSKARGAGIFVRTAMPLLSQKDSDHDFIHERLPARNCV